MEDDVEMKTEQEEEEIAHNRKVQAVATVTGKRVTALSQLRTQRLLSLRSELKIVTSCINEDRSDWRELIQFDKRHIPILPTNSAAPMLLAHTKAQLLVARGKFQSDSKNKAFRSAEHILPTESFSFRGMEETETGGAAVSHKFLLRVHSKSLPSTPDFVKFFTSESSSLERYQLLLITWKAQYSIWFKALQSTLGVCVAPRNWDVAISCFLTHPMPWFILQFDNVASRQEAQNMFCSGHAASLACNAMISMEPLKMDGIKLLALLQRGMETNPVQHPPTTDSIAQLAKDTFALIHPNRKIFYHECYEMMTLDYKNVLKDQLVYLIDWPILRSHDHGYASAQQFVCQRLLRADILPQPSRPISEPVNSELSPEGYFKLIHLETDSSKQVSKFIIAFERSKYVEPFLNVDLSIYYRPKNVQLKRAIYSIWQSTLLDVHDVLVDSMSTQSSGFIEQCRSQVSQPLGRDTRRHTMLIFNQDASGMRTTGLLRLLDYHTDAATGLRKGLYSTKYELLSVHQGKESRLLEPVMFPFLQKRSHDLTTALTKPLRLRLLVENENVTTNLPPIDWLLMNHDYASIVQEIGAIGGINSSHCPCCFDSPSSFLGHTSYNCRDLDLVRNLAYKTAVEMVAFVVTCKFNPRVLDKYTSNQKESRAVSSTPAEDESMEEDEEEMDESEPEEEADINWSILCTLNERDLYNHVNVTKMYEMRDGTIGGKVYIELMKDVLENTVTATDDQMKQYETLKDQCLALQPLTSKAVMQLLEDWYRLYLGRGRVTLGNVSKILKVIRFANGNVSHIPLMLQGDPDFPAKRMHCPIPSLHVNKTLQVTVFHVLERFMKAAPVDKPMQPAQKIKEVQDLLRKVDASQLIISDLEKLKYTGKDRRKEAEDRLIKERKNYRLLMQKLRNDDSCPQYVSDEELLEKVRTPPPKAVKPFDHFIAFLKHSKEFGKLDNILNNPKRFTLSNSELREAFRCWSLFEDPLFKLDIRSLLLAQLTSLFSHLLYSTYEGQLACTTTNIVTYTMYSTVTQMLLGPLLVLLLAAPTRMKGRAINKEIAPLKKQEASLKLTAVSQADKDKLKQLQHELSVLETRRKHIKEMMQADRMSKAHEHGLCKQFPGDLVWAVENGLGHLPTREFSEEECERMQTHNKTHVRSTDPHHGRHDPSNPMLQLIAEERLMREKEKAHEKKLHGTSLHPASGNSSHQRPPSCFYLIGGCVFRGDKPLEELLEGTLRLCDRPGNVKNELQTTFRSMVFTNQSEIDLWDHDRRVAESGWLFDFSAAMNPHLKRVNRAELTLSESEWRENHLSIAPNQREPHQGIIHCVCPQTSDHRNKLLKFANRLKEMTPEMRLGFSPFELRDGGHSSVLYGAGLEIPFPDLRDPLLYKGAGMRSTMKLTINNKSFEYSKSSKDDYFPFEYDIKDAPQSILLQVTHSISQFPFINYRWSAMYTELDTDGPSNDLYFSDSSLGSSVTLPLSELDTSSQVTKEVTITCRMYIGKVDNIDSSQFELFSNKWLTTSQLTCRIILNRADDPRPLPPIEITSKFTNPNLANTDKIILSEAHSQPLRFGFFISHSNTSVTSQPPLSDWSQVCGLGVRKFTWSISSPTCEDEMQLSQLQSSTQVTTMVLGGTNASWGKSPGYCGYYSPCIPRPGIYLISLVLHLSGDRKHTLTTMIEVDVSDEYTALLMHVPQTERSHGHNFNRQFIYFTYVCSGFDVNLELHIRWSNGTSNSYSLDSMRGTKKFLAVCDGPCTAWIVGWVPNRNTPAMPVEKVRSNEVAVPIFSDGSWLLYQRFHSLFLELTHDTSEEESPQFTYVERKIPSKLKPKWKALVDRIRQILEGGTWTSESLTENASYVKQMSTEIAEFDSNANTSRLISSKKSIENNVEGGSSAIVPLSPSVSSSSSYVRGTDRPLPVAVSANRFYRAAKAKII